MSQKCWDCRPGGKGEWPTPLGKLQQTIQHLTDMVGAGESDVRAWMEIHLLLNQPFGSFVDVYVLLELVIVGHPNLRAATMKRNMKLRLEANKALVLKTFKNKLPGLFGQR
eukprot:6857643-Ditylum_brightwellii.AAC.1